MSEILRKLHLLAIDLENNGFIIQASEVDNIFVKVAAKKKKNKSGKNVPNNPSLWASCKAWAKSTFDVYPCVPLDSMALTKKGWAEYSDLNIGDEILTYNQSKDKLEWKPVVNLHFHEDAPTLSLKKLQTNFKVRCTPDHKWVLKTPNVKYPDNLVEAKNITKRMNLKTAAEIVDDVNENLNLSNWRKGDDWVENILKMSKAQLEAFFAAGIVYDGHDKGLSSLNRSTYGFSQKNTNHGEAMEIAAVLLGYRVCFVQKMHNAEMKSWTFVKRDSESTGNLIIEEDLNCDVWCPQTENNTWVMKQGRIITITGNSAYANGAAAKRYKSKGGTWRKADSELNTRLAQLNKFDIYDGQSDYPVTETPDTIEDPSDEEIAEVLNNVRGLDEQAEGYIREHDYNSAQLIIDQIENIKNQYPGEVARVAKLVVDRLRTFVNIGREKYPVEDATNPGIIREISLKDALEEVKKIIFEKGDYDKAIKFVKDVNLTDGNKDYLSKMLDILIIAKKANPGAKMEIYNDANQYLYLAKQKAQRSNQSANLGFQNIGKTDELIYNYLRKMIQDEPINTGYNQNVYKLALELARLKSKI